MNEIATQNNTISPTENENQNIINNNEKSNLTTNPTYKISYEKNEQVLLMSGSKSEAKKK